MADKERIAGLAEQIELARKYLEELPPWMRVSSYFSGTNHLEESDGDSDLPEQGLAPVPGSDEHSRAT
jgi:hypothetical protein